MKTLCPNCISPIQDHPENGCVVAALIQVLREREEHSDKHLLKVFTEVNPDSLWDDLGPILDKLARGYYNCEE